MIGSCYINHGCYTGKTFFSCGMDSEGVYKRLKGHWKQAFEGTEINEYHAYTLNYILDGEQFTYIILPDFDFSDEDMITLAHECTHLCQFILSGILDRDQEKEAEAHFHSHIMTQCLENLRKWCKK